MLTSLSPISCHPKGRAIDLNHMQLDNILMTTIITINLLSFFMTIIKYCINPIAKRLNIKKTFCIQQKHPSMNKNNYSK